MPPLLRTSLNEVVVPEKTALLVIDLQNDFAKDERRQAIIPRVARLLASARKAGIRVVYVQNTVLPGGMSDSPADVARRQGLGIPTDVTVEGTVGHQFVDQIRPIDGEPIVRKHRLNGFMNTTLDTILRSQGRDAIICVGSATHGCIINTAYGGVALNYYVVVAKDCVASWRADLHDAALLLLENTINFVTDSDTLKASWEARTTASVR